MSVDRTEGYDRTAIRHGEASHNSSKGCHRDDSVSVTTTTVRVDKLSTVLSTFTKKILHVVKCTQT